MYFHKTEERGSTVKRKKTGIVVVFAAAMLLCGCVDQHPEETSETAKKSDDKLVATSPAVAEICDRLDLDLIGVCETSRELPERYENVTQVGNAMSPDLEVIKSLSPDYVLSPSSLQSDLQPKYEAAQVSSIFLNLKSVEGMYASISDLGEKFDREKEAQELVDDYEIFMKEYRAKTQEKEKPKVLILMGLPGSYIVATENSYVGNLVELAGGENVYAGTDDEFLTANTEDMKTKEPDIILRASHAMPDQVQEMFAEEFANNDIWQHFKAVQDGKVYDLDNSLFNMSANFGYQDALEELQPILYGEMQE